jgi:hypothetical protein
VAKRTKHAPPIHVLIVDTNVLWLEDKGPAVNLEFDKFWEDYKNLLPMELVIPEVVRDELVVQHCSSGQKLMNLSIPLYIPTPPASTNLRSGE